AGPHAMRAPRFRAVARWPRWDRSCPGGRTSRASNRDAADRPAGAPPRAAPAGRRGGARALARGGDPSLDVGAQEWQRDGAVLQHMVVKRADVELAPQPALGERAQPADLEPADSIGQPLGGPDRVAIDADFC